MSDGVVLTVGNRMTGDDGAGPLLASLLLRAPASGWQVLDGGSAPENVVHCVRALAPERVLIVDATEMALAAGEIRLFDERYIANNFIMTTHNLPLSFLIASLRETVPEVRLLGIQPSVVSFGFPLSPAVEAAVKSIHAALQCGTPLDAWPALSPP